MVRGKIGMHTSPAYRRGRLYRRLHGVDIAGPSRQLHRRRSTRRGSPWSAARSRRATQPVRRPAEPLRRARRPDVAGRRVGPVGAGLLRRARRPSRSRAGCSGISSTAGSPRPSSPWVWRWPAPMRWARLARATIEYLVDLIVDVQTVRSCLTAAERDPEFTPEGYCSPNHTHLAAGSLAMLKARPRMSEILRILPGSSLVVAPSDRDLADPALAQAWRNRSAAAATPRCSARPCCRWRGIMSAPPSTIAKRSSSCTPTAASRLARAAAAQLQPLQRAGQRRAAALEPADAENRPAVDPQCPAGRAAAGHPDGPPSIAPRRNQQETPLRRGKCPDHSQKVGQRFV